MRNLVFFAFLFCSTLSFADEKSETCENIAKLANSGKLWNHKILPREIKPSEIKQFNSLVQTGYQIPNQIVEIHEGGKNLKLAYLISENPSSCWGMTIGNFDMAIETKGEDFGRSYEPSINNDDTVDLSLNGADDDVVKIKDNYFVISTNYSFGRKSLKTASIIQDGHIHEMCEFTRNKLPKLVVKKAVDKNLCQRVVEGQVKKLPWTHVDDGRVTWSGKLETSLQNLTADINMDSKPDIIALLDESSGGGCGSSNYSLVSLSQDGNEILNNDLTKALLSAGDSQNDYLGHDSNEIQIMIYKNKPYILGNSKLQSIWHNKLKTWCEFDYLLQY